MTTLSSGTADIDECIKGNVALRSLFCELYMRLNTITIVERSHIAWGLLFHLPKGLASFKGFFFLLHGILDYETQKEVYLNV